jgi:hypothetical protein
MSDVTTTIETVVPSPRRCDERRRREARPERITIGGEDFVRNDVVAEKYKTTERSINRGDMKGAPFLILHGVKYRPEDQYDEFLKAQIIVRGQPPKRRHVGQR